MKSKGLAQKLYVEDEDKRGIKDNSKFLSGVVVVPFIEKMKIAPSFFCSSVRLVIGCGRHTCDTLRGYFIFFLIELSVEKAFLILLDC